MVWATGDSLDEGGSKGMETLTGTMSRREMGETLGDARIVHGRDSGGARNSLRKRPQDLEAPRTEGSAARERFPPGALSCGPEMRAEVQRGQRLLQESSREVRTR